MARLLWLADACRGAGLRVLEVEGWRTRGSATFAPKGGVVHHTAGAAGGNMPSLRVLIDGRPGIPGPLSQLGLGRDGTVYVIASGRANHAGDGGWRGLAGNTSVWGIEAESVGDGSDWTTEQLAALPVLVRTLADRCGHGIDMVCGHKEWAPRRKIDPAGIDMDDLRAAASRLGEEDEMASIETRRGLARLLYLNLLGRHPKAAEQEQWAQAIQSAGLDAVVREIADSDEAKARRAPA